MSEVKKRVTVTLDPDLLDVADKAVEAGEVRSVSAWVNDAMDQKWRAQQNARTLIRQDAAEARQRDPEEYERARAWAESIMGGPEGGPAEGEGGAG